MELASQSLKKRAHDLSIPQHQVEFLESLNGFPSFRDKLIQYGFENLKPSKLEIMQLNLGKMCNQSCKHCHVDAGPDRKEIMTMETMQDCINAVERSGASIVDLTGGAPEMNPNFRWLVKELRKLGKHIMVRCNLTIILANPKYRDLPEFFKNNGIEVVSSLPHFSAMRTDAQRGKGVFNSSIEALKMLNKAGYGINGTKLLLNLVYNPTGAFLPSGQHSLEEEFREKLRSGFGIEFNHLFAITNMPISRFLEYLIASGNYEEYMEKLVQSFNPMAVEPLMCRNTLSISWDGKVYDCDFNQMLELETSSNTTHISEFDFEEAKKRNIVIGNHCFGCTAGAGSSCGGELT